MVGGTPSGIAVSGNDVWVANSGTLVVRINAATGLVTATVHVGGSPQALTVANGKVWVTVQRRALPPATETQGTLVIDRPSPRVPMSLDPTQAGLPDAEQILYTACLNLVNYPDSGGIAGERLAPDAATHPTLLRDRRVLTFEIGKGQRFSPPSNQIVTATTFKSHRANPRSPLASPGLGYLASVVGAPAFAAGKAAHVSGIVARGNTLVIHLRQRDPAMPSDLAKSVFCALPTDTPLRPLNGAIPSAGPYFIAAESPTQGVELDPTPITTAAGPHALRKIVIRYGMSTEQSVSRSRERHGRLQPARSVGAGSGPPRATLWRGEPCRPRRPPALLREPSPSPFADIALNLRRAPLFSRANACDGRSTIA